MLFSRNPIVGSPIHRLKNFTSSIMQPSHNPVFAPSLRHILVLALCSFLKMLCERKLFAHTKTGGYIWRTFHKILGKVDFHLPKFGGTPLFLICSLSMWRKKFFIIALCVHLDANCPVSIWSCHFGTSTDGATIWLCRCITMSKMKMFLILQRFAEFC